jgi:hypothetical protein
MKRLLRVLLVIAVVLLVAGFAARRYLSSRQVADQVAAKLKTLYGGPVKVAAVDIGLYGSSVNGFELFEKDGAGSQAAWLTIEELDADISLFNLLRGDAVPGNLHVTGAKVLFRFDKEGKLLTALPSQALQGDAPGAGAAAGNVPEINLVHSQIIFRKEGSPDLVLDNVHGKLAKQKDQFVLTGGAENPQWGPWKLGGQFSQDSPKIRVELKSGGTVHVTQAMLDQVPFVPSGIWGEVRISEGDTPVFLNLTYDLQDKQIHYRVDLDAARTNFQVTALALSAVNAQGKLTIEDQLVQVRNVEGEAFAGRLRVDGNLDFGSDAVRLDLYRIVADGLDVSRFPPSWDFPRQITGKLKGRASLKVVITPEALVPARVAEIVGLVGVTGAAVPSRLAALALPEPATSKIHTEGAGQGEIVDAHVAGQPTAAPIGLELRAVRGGFRFGGMDQEARVPAEKDAGRARQKEGVFVRTMSNLVLPFLLGVQDKDKDAPKKDDASYLNINLKMKDVDLEKFEQDMNVKLPFLLAGKVSFEVKVAIPLNESRDLKKYKVHGSAQLSRFVLGDLKLESLEAEVNFKDGILSLPTLKGRLPPDAGESAAGTFAGTGSLQVEPVGDLKVNLKVEDLALGQIAKLGGAGDLVRGDLSGTMSAIVPGKSLTDSTTWQATAQVTSKHMSVLDWDLRDASARLRLDKGELALTDFHGNLQDAPVTASAQVRVAAPYPFSGKVSWQDADLAAVLKRLPLQGRLPVSADGKVQTAATFNGTTAPLQLQGKLDLKAPKLRVQNIPAQQIHATVGYQNGIVDYRLEGRSLGGTFELEGQIPPTDSDDKRTNKKGHLQIKNLQIHRLLEAFNVGEAAQAFRGRIDVRLDFTHRAKDAWPTGSGRLSLTNVRYQDILLADYATTDLSLSSQMLRMPDLYGDFGAGTFRAKLGVNLKHPERSWFTVDLDNVEAAHLLGPWLGETVQGSMHARIRGKFGAEWTGTADLEMAHGKVVGLDITQWHLPATYRYAPAEGTGEIHIREATSAQIGHGKLTGNLNLAWNYTMRVEGRLDMARVDLQTLLRQTVGATQVGGGLVTARFDFSGREMHSVNDLTGTISATLEQTQAMRVPVLRQISPFLGIGPNTTFQNGNLRARLERGTVQIAALALEGTNVHVFIEGNVSLQGRLDLDATGGVSILGVGPSRLVHLHAGGTMHSPSIRILPLATATQAARLFLLRGLVPKSVRP